MFESEDRQLRAVHLILDFEPLSNNFQDIGHVIRAGDPRLRKINVSIPGFLAREDVVPVELPFHHSPREVAVPREETAFSRLSLKAEIDQFHLEEDREEQGGPIIQLLNSEDKLDKSSVARSPKLIVMCVDSGFEEEDERLLDNKKKGLRNLLKAKGLGPKVASGSAPPAFPPSPSSSYSRPTPHPQLEEENEREGDCLGRGGSPQK